MYVIYLIETLLSVDVITVLIGLTETLLYEIWFIRTKISY